MSARHIDCAVIFCIRGRDGTLSYLASTTVTRIDMQADIEPNEAYPFGSWTQHYVAGPTRWSAEGIGLDAWTPGDPMPEPPAPKLPAPKPQLPGGRT